MTKTKLDLLDGHPIPIEYENLTKAYKSSSKIASYSHHKMKYSIVNFCENPMVRSMEYDDTNLPLKLNLFAFRLISLKNQP